MAIIIGKDKKNQKRVERSDVLKGMREARMEATKKKEEQKAAAAEAEAAKEAAKAARGGNRVNGRRKAAAVKEENDGNKEVKDGTEA